MSQPLDIAIVGFDARFADAPDPDACWTAVRRGHDAARDTPAERWIAPPERMLSDTGAPDRAWSRRACLLDPFTPDLSGLTIDAALVERLDPLFGLTLHVGGRAWRSAATSGVDPARAAVFLAAIALPTDGSSAWTRRTRGARRAGQRLGADHPTARSLAAAAADPLDTQVCGQPAALLAEALGLAGGWLTLDAACASSLYAIKLACDALAARRIDAALAGGVSRPECLYTQVGFSQLQALSRSGRCRPFDAAADGLVVGEGAGLFVLKRRADAIRDGDTIHGLIRGIGLSNDTAGSLLAADSGGQLRAMRAAYAQAGWQPRDVRMIDCHGTGTPKGDATELRSLRALWRESEAAAPGAPYRCALGSAKANVGHTLTAAGAAGLLRVLLALRAGEIPPAANFAAPAEELADDGPFYCPREVEDWRARDGRRRAAVSAFGFGGINAHLLVESGPAIEAGWGRPRTRAGGAARDAAAAVREDAGSAAEGQFEPIAVVGAAVRVGAIETLEAYAQHLFRGQPLADAQRRAAAVRFPAGRFRLPPNEASDLLGQQLLMLEVAHAALADAGRVERAERPRDGLYIGIQLDPRTSDYHLRWAVPDAFPGDRPLTSTRVLGALGGIAASRVAREFGFGGPSFTLTAGRLSGLRGIEFAADALRSGELDLALVGAVELATDERLAPLCAERGAPGSDAAGAVVLKRLSDAERDGDRIRAVIDSMGLHPVSRPARPAGVPADDACADGATVAGRRLRPDQTWRGNAGVASGLLTVIEACLALSGGALPGSWCSSGRTEPWLRDRARGPRRLTLTCRERLGPEVRGALRAAPDARAFVALPGPPAAFLFAGESAAQVSEQIGALVAELDGMTDPGAAAAERAGAALAAAGPRAAIVGTSRAALADAARELREHLARSPARRPESRRAFYEPAGAGFEGEVAFVFPGSGVHAPRMGLGLVGAFPAIMERQEAETQHLASQLRPPGFVEWERAREGGLATAEVPVADAITAQVACGILAHDVLRAIGVSPDATIGYSLGETTALCALRVWGDRDELFARMQRSPLFRETLAGRCVAARAYWQVPDADELDWSVAAVPRAADAVRAALADEQAFLLAVNAPDECVIGGRGASVRRVAARLDCEPAYVRGASTVHCPLAGAAVDDYRTFHHLPTTPVEGVRVYSAARGAAYEPTADAAADAITALATATFDFDALVRRAYDDGVRVFIEVGPGAACTRMIGRILAACDHLALALAPSAEHEAEGAVVLAARLAVRGIVPDLRGVYTGRPAREAAPAVRADDIVVRLAETEDLDEHPRQFVSASAAADAQALRADWPAVSTDLAQRVAAAGLATARAHERFLAAREAGISGIGEAVSVRARLARHGGPPVAPAAALPTKPVFDFADGLEFARGRVVNVFGAAFAEMDTFAVRTRLPDEPLMLVHRVTALDATPRALDRGRVTTEHDVWAGAWYLDNGRAPVCISVEAGQADMFLAAYLGIDFEARGARAYRLLDAEIAFHRPLPQVGETIRYDIRIHRFVNQGAAWLFFFEFDATIAGAPLLTMRNGCAGYFNEQEIERSGGIVETPEEAAPRAGRVSGGYAPLLPVERTQLSEGQVDALRRGDLATAFGPPFDALPLAEAVRLPDGLMRLVHRVVELDAEGGKYGLGVIRAEADVRPDDWFLTCHFVDDMVMPGTLMYECCAHTLRILLTRMGWVGAHAEIHYEPVAGVTTKLRCRGPVTPRTKVVTYEVMIKEIGWGAGEGTGREAPGAPYVIADAYMYADGRRIVRFVDMSMQLAGTSEEALRRLWEGAGHRAQGPGGRRWASQQEPSRSDSPSAGRPVPGALPPPPPIGAPDLPAGRAPALYDSDRILAFAVGDPAEAFGERYRLFSSGEKRIARLPGPPYAFLSRITQVHARPWELEKGVWIEAQYDVPPEAWYFAANRQRTMPFAVLLEIPLQACGWLAAHGGAALRAEPELFFRNLGGTATLHEEPGPDAGTLTIRVKQTDVSQAGEMILVKYDLQLWRGGVLVYDGDTQFGFFTGAALANQVGVRDAGARRYEPDAAERARGRSWTLGDHEPLLPTDQPPLAPPGAELPGKALRMIDEIELLVADGGPDGLGFVRGVKHVDPDEWLFKAHFYRDPVCPGSLGLESFLQLLKVLMLERFPKAARARRFEPIAVGRTHTWIYRGQIIPRNRAVTVDAIVTEVIEGPDPTVIARGFLSVDGKVIYEMREFGMRLVRS